MTKNNINILLQFDNGGGGACPVQYDTTYHNDHYFIRYRHSCLTIDKNDITIYEFRLAPEKYDDGFWSDRETNVYLHLLSQAITTNTLDDLILPTIEESHIHQLHALGEYPKYIDWKCGKTHTHTDSCPYQIISAKDLNPIQRKKMDHYYNEIRDDQKK